ncbi:MAG: intracellular septation protein [Phenylobacterium sp.]|nr:intracellular septation protein [Phenylobacterium sp.]
MTPKVARWVRLFVDYAGLVAFLVTIAITGSAIAASWAVVAGSLAALAVGFALEKRLAPIPLVTAIFGVLFGGATLIFHDERIIKMKLTILDAGIGVFLLTGALRGKNPLKALMGDAFHLPDPVVRILTLRYALFFFALAATNEVVWRTQSTRMWGFFKFPGVPLLIFLFAMTQAPLMMKHMPDDKPADETPAKD